MGETSGISWTNRTWNPVMGCSKVSEGCNNCYAETLALRYGWTPHPWAARFADENVTLKPQKLGLPLTPKWSEASMIFVNSMSDVFHENVPDDYIDKMWGIMALASQHTFQVLTKRPERMRMYLSELTTERIKHGALSAMKPTKIDTGYNNVLGLLPDKHRETLTALVSPVLPNVWVGTSVELQKWVYPRLSSLTAIDAAVRFVSAEPLLGPLDLTQFMSVPGTPELDWVIVGGESGAGRRPFDMAWARSIKDQCEFAGVAFFMKQVGAFKSGQHHLLTETDGTCWRWEQFPGALPLAAPEMVHDADSGCEYAIAEKQEGMFPPRTAENPYGLPVSDSHSSRLP